MTVFEKNKNEHLERFDKIKDEHLKVSRSLKKWRSQHPNPYRDEPMYSHYNYGARKKK